MIGTHPRIGPRTQLVAATIAAGFGSVAAVVALALTQSLLVTLLAGATPIVVVLVGALDYPDDEPTDRDHPDPIRGSTQPDMTDQPIQADTRLSTDGGIDAE